MPFEKGSISFTICTMQQKLPEDAIGRFEEKKGYSLDTVLDEPQIGWVSGRHLLDTQIDELTAYVAGYLKMTLRSAVRKIPPSFFKAEYQQEELAEMQATNSFFLSRKQVKEIKESIKERLLKEMPPALSGTTFVVDSNSDIMYLGAGSCTEIDKFLSVFHETIGFEPIPLTAETSAEFLFRIDPDTLPRLDFTESSSKTHDVDTSFGRDFLTWIWFFQEVRGGTFDVSNIGEFGLSVQGPLTFSEEGVGAQETVVRRGLPTLSGEARLALLSGKKLTRARILLVKDDETWEFTLDADNFIFKSVKLPQIEPLDPISHFQERIKYLGLFRQAFLSLFRDYLALVQDKGRFEELSQDVIRWAKEEASKDGS